MDYQVPAGMPLEVWIDKYSRKKEDGYYQTWAERCTDVVNGNFALEQYLRSDYDSSHDYRRTLELAKQGVIAFAGRHLQHGDEDQPEKMGEYFTNCSTAMFTWSKLWLLLKGSGVGRCYDSDMCFVDWDFLPNARFVLSSTHPDFDGSWMESLEEAKHKYDSDSEKVRWFTVGDSAEGWTLVVMILETAAFHKNNRDHLFVFDFSQVRPRGSPIRGQQMRPSSGPAPFMRSLHQLMSVKGAGYRPWRQALFIDHYLSSAVAFGGVRRSARMATKSWRDRDVIEFIDIKRGGWLYTANNSITVDAEFWAEAKHPRPSHARRVFEAAVSAAYWDRTGEPGFINIDKLSWSNEGINEITAGNYIDPDYAEMFGGIHPKTTAMIAYTLAKAKAKKYPYIVNPCGEIVLANYGGYCVISDVCLMNCKTLKDAEDAVELVAKALIRANRMNFLYSSEVRRTNRIGVSLTGIHEFAKKFFELSFKDLLLDWDTPDKKKRQSYCFWAFLGSLRERCERAAEDFARRVGVQVPHTFTCVKPAGTVSKVLDCTEGANLPSMAYYLRWVQFRSDHPILEDYRKRGYPMKDIGAAYKDTWVVGFPTRQRLADMLGDELVTAGQATPQEQYKWLKRLEENWIGPKGNQVSYTMKYDPDKVSYSQFMELLTEFQSTVRCCTVMPQVDVSAYVYTPEERLTKEQYEEYMGRIQRADREAYDAAKLECESGACPIETNINESVMDAF